METEVSYRIRTVTLFQEQKLHSIELDRKMTMNIRWGRIWKEAIVAHFTLRSHCQFKSCWTDNHKDTWTYTQTIIVLFLQLFKEFRNIYRINMLSLHCVESLVYLFHSSCRTIKQASAQICRNETGWRHFFSEHVSVLLPTIFSEMYLYLI
jgi:hypothetical protein